MAHINKLHTTTHTTTNATTKDASTKLKGTVVKWHDDKGFGFIESEDGSSNFFHVSQYRPPKRPELGEQVVYELGEDNQGRLQAKNVQELAFVQTSMQKSRQRQVARKNQKDRRQQARRQHQASFEAGQKNRLFLVVGLYTVLTVIALFGDLPWWIVGWYAVMGVVTFMTYYKDKQSAQNGAWRTPESTLHLLAVLGGWGGAILAQTYLRHKSRKPEFQRVFYVTVLINLAILVGYLFGVVG